MVEAKFNLKISVLQCDNGREYTSNDLKAFRKENGTHIDYTVPYTPELNGKVERFNRSLLDKARAMVEEANMPKSFWNEAIRVSACLLNRSPSASNIDNRILAGIWYNKKSNVTNLRVFGSIAFAHVPDELRKKFDSKSEKCIMIGYITQDIGYGVLRSKE